MGKAKPRCLVIAGPNGAGKTTFARQYLPREGAIMHFVNADLIASGLSPLQPDLAAIQAGKLFLEELDRLSRKKVDFAFESTLSGLGYIERIRRWRRIGYRIEIVYLRLNSVDLAVRRVAARKKEGGHFVPTVDVIRRFPRSWNNFLNFYRPLAHDWSIYDASYKPARLLEYSR